MELNSAAISCMVFHSPTGGSSYLMILPASECSRSSLPSGAAITSLTLPKDIGCFCPPAVIASPSSAPDSASAASLLIRRTLSNDVTGDPARILRRFSAGFGSTAAACSNPTGSASSRTRRAAAVLPEPGGPENSIAGVWWCTQNMWQRCAQKRGRCDSRTRSRAQNASSHPSPPRSGAGIAFPCRSITTRASGEYGTAGPCFLAEIPYRRRGRPPRSTHRVWPSKPTRLQTRSASSPSNLARSRCAASAGVM